MINNKDNLGNQLSKEQIEYFKDTKIVDKDNNLLVCYHGSPTPYFNEFNPKDNKSQFGKYKFGDKNVNYFTTDRQSAASYTEFGYDDGTLFEVYINIKNPFIVDNKTEREFRSSFNISDDRVRQKQIDLFDKIFNKWKDQHLYYAESSFEQLNKDLRKLNYELRPSEDYKDDVDEWDIEYFDLWFLGSNHAYGQERIKEFQYSTDELFSDDMYDQLKDDIIGDVEEKDYIFTTDDIVRYVLEMDEGYDGIIISDILDSKSLFSTYTTDIITLGSSNQIKSISNKNPSSSNRIDEVYVPYISDRYLLWKGPEYSKEPKNDKIRLYHQTMKDNIPSIIKNGLQGKYKRSFDNPGGDVIWASNKQPTDSSHWNYGNCVFELDLPKDFDMRKVNSSDYNIYQDISPKYINALYLQSPYREPIMRDFQNTLDIQKSIDRFMNGELKEGIDWDNFEIIQDDDELDLDPGNFDPFDPDELAQLINVKEIEEPRIREPQKTDKNSYWYKSMLDTIEQSRKYRKGITFKLDQEDKEYLEKNYPDYSFKIIDLKDVIEKNNLDKPEHGMFSRRVEIWGEEPELYWYSKDKDTNLNSPIRLRSDLTIIDGNHRLYALYNMGYSKAEVLVYDPNKLNETLLLEVSRRDLINKSKKGASYSPKNQALGRNRWERKKWSRVANTTREFNSIDMNTFFKKDILIVNVPVKGETNDYIVKIKFEGVVNEIQKNVQANNNKLDYRIISQALSRVFNSGDVYINCNCPDFKFRFNHWSTVQGYSSGKPENRPNRFTWTNSQDNMGSACKHGNLVLSNLSWMMKVASVINNYIHYAETYMQRQFADIIFPKIYGVKYPEALQLGMFDRMYLKHSKGVIDAINEYGSTRTRFKKTKTKEEPQETEIEQNPKQLSLFDDVDDSGNKGFKKSTIYDYGVDEPEDVEVEHKGFKPNREQPKIKNKGFKQLSLFNEEESE